MQSSTLFAHHEVPKYGVCNYSKIEGLLFLKGWRVNWHLRNILFRCYCVVCSLSFTFHSFKSTWILECAFSFVHYWNISHILFSVNNGPIKGTHKRLSQQLYYTFNLEILCNTVQEDHVCPRRVPYGQWVCKLLTSPLPCPQPIWNWAYAVCY